MFYLIIFFKNIFHLVRQKNYIYQISINNNLKNILFLIFNNTI